MPHVKHADLALKRTPHRESPAFELKWDVCRECRHIQQVTVIRGWHVCRGCLEQMDQLFTSIRATAQEEGFRSGAS